MTLQDQPNEKTLDTKLEQLRRGASSEAFILADAKDADMAFGISAPGWEVAADGSRRLRTLRDYRARIRDVVNQKLVDIMLMSASSCDAPADESDLFSGSPVTPAIRANDTTDIWLAGAPARYGSQPSLPFRTAHIAPSSVEATPGGRAWRRPADLGLYSVTFNNDAALDRETLRTYADFRREALVSGFRHFLEVFPPNVEAGLDPEDVPRFVNNCIVRSLAGVARCERPLFLKIPYFGRRAIEELVNYDDTLVVGILGGSAGTTMDAFHMLWEARRSGARAALFGRKINAAEHQLTFVRILRAIADGQLAPEDAVGEYHHALGQLGLKPHRTLADDRQRTTVKTAYGS